MDNEDELYGKVYELILLLVKKYHLMYHMHFTVYTHEEDFIKIWEDGKEKEGKYICNIREKGEGKKAECLRKAIYEMTYYQKQREETEKRTDTDNTDVAG
ncbi:MAG: hypothetical protein K2N41_09590 [Lachnospiraceae bacterium]|nr:hypothetical protein [Lachnospiraceae bacterium]